MEARASRSEVAGRSFADPLTGLGSRDRLIADLARAVAPGSPATLLVVFCLDGFSEHRELYGRLSSRSMVMRLATRLAQALGDAGTAYRPREDEFAALLHVPVDSAKQVVDAALAALGEPGKHLTVRSACGGAMLPEEASDPVEALRIADERLAANAPRRPKRERRAFPREQAGDRGNTRGGEPQLIAAHVVPRDDDPLEPFPGNAYAGAPFSAARFS